jgi:deoxyribodipyrimidine photolyase-related protein
MNPVLLIFPHQLFENSPLFSHEGEIYLVEEDLFFTQYAFHKQKLAFHRASMQFYKQYLEFLGKNVTYISTTQKESDIRLLVDELAKSKTTTIHSIDPTDNWLEKRLKESCNKHNIELIVHQNPHFLNSREDLDGFFRKDKKKFFQTEFYIQQRKKRDILLEEKQSPKGGKWSFDSENRKKYPKGKQPPSIHFPKFSSYHKEAVYYIEKHFKDNPGQLEKKALYPIDFEGSKNWFQDFLAHRFLEFGTYEDAMVKNESILNHSVLSPLLNNGLLSIDTVVQQSLAFAEEHDVPLNSVEGFIRQLIGWREFIRGVYQCKGSAERTTNFWGFKRKIPASFYTGDTGIEPLDEAIQKTLKTAYCHHIERLMILGNFMLLCEFDPDEVYRWFMELFIDAYDWVMVPNVYGMSQFADGGLMSTKPYISGSNYVLKMSNHPKGEWQEIWDGLFWRFMDTHRDFFLKNPRIGMLVRTFDKMSPEKKANHLQTAENYLQTLNA